MFCYSDVWQQMLQNGSFVIDKLIAINKDMFIFKIFLSHPLGPIAI